MDDRQKLYKNIQIYGFALGETMLFLDTHPDDQKALAFFKMYQKLKDESVLEYTKKYGPITAENGMYDTRWTWVDGPWPWENQFEVMA
jgi:spore coat protein JB